MYFPECSSWTVFLPIVFSQFVLCQPVVTPIAPVLPAGLPHQLQGRTSKATALFAGMWGAAVRLHTLVAGQVPSQRCGCVKPGGALSPPDGTADMGSESGQTRASPVTNQTGS